jgi:hypothetical protein
VVVFQP